MKYITAATKFWNVGDFRIDFEKKIKDDCKKQFSVWLSDNHNEIKPLDIITWYNDDNKNYHGKPVIVGNLKEMLFKQEMKDIINE